MVENIANESRNEILLTKNKIDKSSEDLKVKNKDFDNDYLTDLNENYTAHSPLSPYMLNQPSSSRLFLNENIIYPTQTETSMLDPKLQDKIDKLKQMHFQKLKFAKKKKIIKHEPIDPGVIAENKRKKKWVTTADI